MHKKQMSCDLMIPEKVFWMVNGFMGNGMCICGEVNLCHVMWVVLDERTKTVVLRRLICDLFCI